VGETQEQAAGRRDFFVSYTGADQAWAEWIAWELERAGYTTVLQAWDFVAGTNFAHAMHEAATAADHTLAVLSPAYLDSRFGEAEWLAAFITDPLGKGRRLLPVRVEACEPKGLLAGITYVELVGLDEAAARVRLTEEVAGALRGHRRPVNRPRFPAATTPAALGRRRFPTALPPVWNLPWRRNPDFTGREAELAALAAQLEGTPGTVAVTQAQAIQGAGGIGKTSLAVEYAYRHHARFEVVWWLRAEEPASLIGDYAALATALGLPEAAQTDQQQTAAAARGWLAGNDRWLLVVDNAPEPQAATGLVAPLTHLVDLLPQVIGGQVLVTSRDARWERDARLATLDLFTPEEAVRFLLARSGSQDDDAAGKIGELLGHLPLALEQAGAYAREAAISLGDYLQRLERFPELALAKGEPRGRNPADTVAITWRVSLDRVRPVPGALALLEVCAFLAAEDIPRELVAQPLDPPPGDAGLAALAGDPFALDDAVAALRRYGLVKATERALGVHRLLQQVVRASLSPEAAASRAGVAVRLLRAAFPRLFGFDANWGLRNDARIMRRMQEAYGERTFADARIPLFITATDFHTGEQVVLREGRLVDAIRASIAIPFAFRPHPVGGRLLIDGFMSDPLPVGVAMREGANVIVAVGFESPYQTRVSSAGRFAFQLSSIMTNNLLKASFAFYGLAHHSEVIAVIPRFFLRIRLVDTEKMPYIIDEGERAMSEQVPYLRRLLEAAPAS